LDAIDPREFELLIAMLRDEQVQPAEWEAALAPLSGLITATERGLMLGMLQDRSARQDIVTLLESYAPHGAAEGEGDVTASPDAAKPTRPPGEIDQVGTRREGTEVGAMAALTHAFTVTLTEGEKVQVPGTGLTIAVGTVRDFTSQGCLGGPAGCPDHAVLEVRWGEESQQLTLTVAHTPAQRTQGIDRARAFGYSIALTALRGQQVTLTVE
jgi:hypothetical protein